MRSGRWSAAVLIMFGLLAAAVPARAAAPAAEPAGESTVRASPLGLLRRLEVGPERNRGYRSDRFPHWRNADGDGCDTRAEVLVAESVREVVVRSPGCRMSGGRWRSVYDGVTTRDAGDLDIDHVVALKEAWGSGARGWSRARRQAYANDLGDPRALRAVTASTNRSKGDRSPDEWMPPRAGAHCRYLGWWLAIKVRWSLRVDATERAFLRDRLGACPGDKLTVRIVG